MKKILMTALLASGAVTVGGPAYSQELSPFTGLRVEALVGYDKLRNGSDVDIDEEGDDIDESIDGVVYGIGAGFDFDLGSVVVGVEGEFTDSTGNEDADQALNAPFAYRASVGRDLPPRLHDRNGPPVRDLGQCGGERQDDRLGAFGA